MVRKALPRRRPCPGPCAGAPWSLPGAWTLLPPTALPPLRRRRSARCAFAPHPSPYPASLAATSRLPASLRPPIPPTSRFPAQHAPADRARGGGRGGCGPARQAHPDVRGGGRWSVRSHTSSSLTALPPSPLQVSDSHTSSRRRRQAATRVPRHAGPVAEGVRRSAHRAVALGVGGGVPGDGASRSRAPPLNQAGCPPRSHARHLHHLQVRARRRAVRHAWRGRFPAGTPPPRLAAPGA